MYYFKSKPLIILSAVIFAFLLAAPLSAIEIGKDAPDFTLKTHDGKSLTLSKLEGKRGAVLVFFATWCPSCMAEVPHVKKFVEESKDKNVLVYGVNIQQPLRIVEKFVESYEVNYRVLLDKGEAARAYGVRGIPYVVGINAEGKVIYADHAFPSDHKQFINKLTKGIAGVEKSEKEVEVKYITKEELQKMRENEKDLVIVDVLSPSSYHNRHIEGAINIPLKQIEALAYKLPKNGPIVTYCANFSCKASTHAAKKLIELGYKNVYDYEGGIKDWFENKLPVKEGKEINFIKQKELKQLIENEEDILIIDVLSPESYQESHIKGAINIPLGKVGEKAKELDKKQKIIVYCANYVCQASSKAAEKLQDAGFKNVYDYKGGLKEWEDAGLPLGEGK